MYRLKITDYCNILKNFIKLLKIYHFSADNVSSLKKEKEAILLNELIHSNQKTNSHSNSKVLLFALLFNSIKLYAWSKLT